MPLTSGTASTDWHLQVLEVENFRCFRHFRIDFDPSLTVLVGKNGVGKTAILDSAAIMLSTILKSFSGPTRGFASNDAREIPYDIDSRTGVARMEPAYPVRASVEVRMAGNEFWWTRTRHSANGRTSWAERNTAVGRYVDAIWRSAGEAQADPPILPIIALYGVERLLNVRKESKAIPRSRSGAYEAALDGRSDLSRLSSYIRALVMTEFLSDQRGESSEASANQLRAIELACNSILEDSGWRNPVWNEFLSEITLTHPRHGSLPLSYLSSGIKITVGIVLDLVSRMARANPKHGAERLLKNGPGIVLIDEIDLHLHPSWQQRILPQLRKTFPSVQFIVTTHSPQVLSTVSAEHIRVLDESGVQRVSYAEGLRSDIVLDQILNTSPEPPVEINRTLDTYMSLVETGKGRSEEAVLLRRELDEELGGIVNVPRLADADANIALYDELDLD